MADSSMDTGIFHEFTSAVPDDPTFIGTVQPQAHWNHNHIIVGGDHGNVLTVDDTQPSRLGFSTVQSAISGRVLAFASTPAFYSGVSPSPALATTQLNLTKAASLLIVTFEVRLVDSTQGLASQTFSTFKNASFASQHNYIIANIGSWTFIQYDVAPIGLTTFHGQLTANLGPIVTGSYVLISMIAFG